MARTKKTAVRNVGGKSVKTMKRAHAATGGAELKVRKPRRYRPGTVALREIRKQQKSLKHAVHKAPFQRIVRQVTLHDPCARQPSTIRWQKEAIEALHEATETYIVHKLGLAMEVAIAGKKVELNPDHLHTVAKVREDPVLLEAWAELKRARAGAKKNAAGGSDATDALCVL